MGWRLAGRLLPGVVGLGLAGGCRLDTSAGPAGPPPPPLDLAAVGGGGPEPPPPPARGPAPPARPSSRPGGAAVGPT